jgi:hypothetical protein
MNSGSIAKEIELILLRHKRGLVPLGKAKEELAFQMALLKAQEQAVLEERLERLEAVMEGRKEGQRW